MKKILITGADSYIGTSFEKYMAKFGDKYQIDTLDMIGNDWKNYDFSGYDVIYHVAGIAHSDSGKITREKAKLYYDVNTKLTVAAAKKAKAAGVSQFIFMSSAIVYGNSAPIGKKKIITKDTPVHPANAYGNSKVKAEEGLHRLEDENFKIVILRPPMIYGKDSKGNYPLLAKIANLMPMFPYVRNCRSMLYIENLCEFVRLMIDNNEQGTFWPQNAEYSNTSELVRMIGAQHGKRVVLIKGFEWALTLIGCFTGLVDKAFGNLYYDKKISIYKSNYQIYTLTKSIELTETKMVTTSSFDNSSDGISPKYSILMSVYKNDDPLQLKEAIDSMLCQTVSPEQFVLVVDGPVGGEIEDVIKKYEDNNKIFTIVRLLENGGLGNALNQGLKVCRNELVARMDADDISLPVRCEKQLNEFIHKPKLCILGTQIYEFIGSLDNVVSSRNVPCDFESIKKFAKRRSPFNHPTVMYKKSVIEQLGGYPTLNRKEDLGLFVKAVLEGCYSENLGEALLYYRTSKENFKRRKTWINCKEYIQVMWKFFTERKIGLTDIAYVMLGQMVLYIFPINISKVLNDRFLRNSRL